jgi:putative hemolysin
MNSLETFFIPVVFLLGSAVLEAVRLALENIGLLNCRSELSLYKKSYFFLSFLLEAKKDEGWNHLFSFINITSECAKIAYVTTGSLFLFSIGMPLVGSAYYMIGSFLVILVLFFLCNFLFSLLSKAAPVIALRSYNWVATFFLILFFPISFSISKVLSLVRKRKTAKNPPSWQVKHKLLEFIHETDINQHLSYSDLKLLTSFASFQERIVREVMVPRIDVFSVSADKTIYECLQKFIHEGYSRIPVYEGDIDNIIGILLYKDLLSFFANAKDIDQSKTIIIKELIKPAIFTPESKKISHMLQEFKTKQFHLAIVVDEYGCTEGIVTIEDILEELVGEIEDEYDEGEEKLYEGQLNGQWLVDGKMNIHDIESELGIHIPSFGEYETIGGYIFHRAGCIPKNGWRIYQDNYTIEVVESDEKSIEKVKITPNI